MKSSRERVEENIARQRAAFRDHMNPTYEPSTQDVAMDLVDEDVAAGLYAACSTELDLAADEYMALAEEALR